MKHRTSTQIALSCLTVALMLSGCSDSNTDHSDIQAPNDAPVATLDAQALEQLEGVYEQRGYGNVFLYEDNRTTAYAITENTCLEIANFPGLAGFAPEEVAQTRYALQGEQLTLAFPGDAFVTRFNRLEALPERCNDNVPRDAQGVFEYAWATFNEYYAFFDLRNVDWSAQYATLLPQLGEVTDDESLFALLSELISLIDDGHVFVANDTDGYSPARIDGALQELRRGFEAQNDMTDFGNYVDSIVNQLFNAISSLLDADSIREQGPLVWGTADSGSVGYLFVGRMEGYVVNAMGESLDNTSGSEELVAASAMIDRAMGDLADTSRLVIDVRLNGGGFDAIALEIARRFASERQLVLSKTARSRDFESEPAQAWLEPLVEGAYLNPVTVIMGPDSVGAAEIFAISMKQLPQVSFIGETTQGILSDRLVKSLPNGWAIGLSNEVYRDAQGVSFEATGVSPDINVPVFKIEDIEAGVDPAVEQALRSQ